MMNNKAIKLGVLSLSAGLLLAACDTSNNEDLQDTIPEDETGQVGDTTTDDGTTDDTTTDDGTTDDGTTNDTATDTQGQGLESMTFEVSLEDAISTFYDTFGSEDINIEEIQFNRDDGRFLYEFEGWDDQSDYELDIDAETGDIVQQEQDEDSDTDGDILELDSIVSPEDAMSTALEAAGSGYVEEWDLEVDNGVTVYEIDVEDDDDQKVDALTGELVN